MKTFKQYKLEKKYWLHSRRQEFWNAMNEKKKREENAAKEVKKKEKEK